MAAPSPLPRPRLALQTRKLRRTGGSRADPGRLLHARARIRAPPQSATGPRGPQRPLGATSAAQRTPQVPAPQLQAAAAGGTPKGPPSAPGRAPPLPLAQHLPRAAPPAPPRTHLGPSGGGGPSRATRPTSRCARPRARASSTAAGRTRRHRLGGGESARGPLPAAEGRSPAAPRRSGTSTWGLPACGPPPRSGYDRATAPEGLTASLSGARGGGCGAGGGARRARTGTSRAPVAPRREGERGGGLPVTENPRHGRSRLRGARGWARTGVGGLVPGLRRPRRDPGAGARETEAALLGGGGGVGSEVWGPSRRGAGGRRPRSPAVPGRFPDRARWARGDAASPGTPVLQVSLSRAARTPSAPTLRFRGRGACYGRSEREKNT